MKETENYSFKKPDVKEFFELQTWSDNLDKIDQEIKNRELAQDESNEQIGKMKKISFDEQEEPEELENGETVKSAFGKLAAAVKTLIIHKTLQATDAVLGHVKLSNSAAITKKGLYALDAVEKNATVDGTLAKKISELNDGLKKCGIYEQIAGWYSVSVNTSTTLTVQDITKYRYLVITGRYGDVVRSSHFVVTLQVINDMKKYQLWYSLKSIGTVQFNSATSITFTQEEITYAPMYVYGIY